jgi:hypothetical protein
MKYKAITKIIKLAMLVGVIGLAGQAQAGSIFITGHDSDEHGNVGYMSAGLDFLLFGIASNPADRAGKTVAIIDTFNGASTATTLSGTGYSFTTFDADAAGVAAALSGGFDSVFIGSGNVASAQAALVGASALFTTYFNAGGSIYVNTDEGFGQAWYNFVPSFGTAVNNSISSAGVFSPTAAGVAIGLTEAIVDADITHSYYTGVNTSLFTVLEVTSGLSGVADGTPVAFGLRDGTIGGGGFNGGGNTIPEPSSLALISLGLLGWAGTRRKQKK